MFDEDIGKLRRRNEEERRTVLRGRGGPSSVAISATKPSKDYEVGLGLADKEGGGVEITSVAPDGLLAGTQLRKGMMAETVNGTRCATAKEAMELLEGAEGRVAIMATDPGGKGESSAPTEASTSSSVVAVINKPSKDAPLGMGLEFGGEGKVTIASIDPDGPIRETELKAGMMIDAVNGKRYYAFNEGMALLNGAEGEVRVVASNFDPAPEKDAGNECCLLDGCDPACDCGDCCCVVS